MSNVCNSKISILLNKISRNTKYHVTNVYEKKGIMSQSFHKSLMLYGLKTKRYHITCISNENKSTTLQSFGRKATVILTVFEEEFCTKL